MEQNLSEKERKQRLSLGLLSLGLAVISYFATENLYLTIGFLLASSGFIVNYFTCFCGTKKAIKAIRDKF